MTAISGVGPAAQIGATGRAAAKAGRFSVDDAAGSTTATVAPSSDVSLGGLLALQAEEMEEARDRPARQRGHALLHALAALQRAMLSDGGDSREQLQALADLTTAVPDAADSRLRAAMEAIMLRVRVELARHDLT